MISTNGSSLPCSASYQAWMYSWPTSYAITWLWITTRGMPGMTPWMMSSRLRVRRRRHRDRVALAGQARSSSTGRARSPAPSRAGSGTNSVAMRSPSSPSIANRSAAADRRRAGPSPACRRTPSRRAPSRAARSCTSPITAARSQPGTARSAASAASARSAATKATSLPSLAMYIGSRPRISAAPATAGVTGTSRLAHHIATLDARASSFSTEATPPRVASRMQCSPRPGGVEQRVDGRPQRARVRLDVGVEVELAAGQHDRRAVVADRARDEDPVARRERRRRQARRAGRRRPMPAVVQVHRVGSGRARRPSCRRRRSARRRPRRPRAIASTSARRSSAARPSSSTIASVSASGRAPATARSLTVPFTASSPIEPPGKRIGFTTKLSVVNARAAPPTESSAGVAERRQRGRPERRHEQALDQRLRRLAAGAVRHRDPLVAELRPAAAGRLDACRGRAARARRAWRRVAHQTTARSRAKRP